MTNETIKLQKLINITTRRLADKDKLLNKYREKVEEAEQENAQLIEGALKAKKEVTSLQNWVTKDTQKVLE
jgi:hypothetical protein